MDNWKGSSLCLLLRTYKQDMYLAEDFNNKAGVAFLSNLFFVLLNMMCACGHSSERHECHHNAHPVLEHSTRRCDMGSAGSSSPGILGIPS